MFAWHQTFGGKLDVSNASTITKTPSILCVLLASVIGFLEIAGIVRTHGSDPLRTIPAVVTW